MKCKPDFCPGCGVMVTREPWPHLDRGLLPPTPIQDLKRSAGPAAFPGVPDYMKNPEK